MATNTKDILLATTYPKGFASCANPEPDTWVKVFVTVRAYKVQRFSVQSRYRGRRYEDHFALYSLSEATERADAICRMLTAKGEKDEAERQRCIQAHKDGLLNQKIVIEATP